MPACITKSLSPLASQNIHLVSLSSLEVFLLCGHECRSDICNCESISQINAGGLFDDSVTVITLEYQTV
jgi:hypothetical protein